MHTDITMPMVEHLTNPNDLILNTAQMCDATHLQKFQISSMPLDEETVIQESVARAINQRKSTTVDGSSGTGQGQGHGDSMGDSMGDDVEWGIVRATCKLKGDGDSKESEQSIKTK